MLDALSNYGFGLVELVDLVFQGIILYYLLQGPYRKYRLLTLYCSALLITTVLETFVDHVYHKSHLYITLYYTDEVIVDLLLFLLVIATTYRAMEGSPNRAKTGRVLAFVTAIIALLPFVLFRPVAFNSRWLNDASEVFNFGAAIMNLWLWTALLSSHNRDSQLLTVSAGLGIYVTAQAIGFGVRLIVAPDHLWVPNTFMSVTHLASMYIWWWAFRPAPKTSHAPTGVVTSI